MPFYRPRFLPPIRLKDPSVKLQVCLVSDASLFLPVILPRKASAVEVF